MSGPAAAAAGAATAGRVARFKNPYWHQFQKQNQKEKLFLRNIARSRGATDFRGRPIFTPFTWNVTRGDLVQITQPSLVRDMESKKPKQNQLGQTMTQKWLGQQGVVLKVLRDQERVIVKGVNFKTRVAKPNEQARGYSYLEESPIPYQHVTLVDPSTGQPAVGPIKRVRREGKTGRDRVVVSSSTMIPTPDRGQLARIPPRVNARTDTAAADVLAETYVKPVYTAPSALRDEVTGLPVTISEQLALNFDEIVALKKRNPNSLSNLEKKMLETRTKTVISTVLVPESTELRAARIKF